MLHAKFQDHRSFGSGEKYFKKVFTIYGRGGHLCPVTWIIYINFRSPFQRRLHLNLALIGQAVSEEKMFEIVDDHEYRRRTMGII